MTNSSEFKLIGSGSFSLSFLWQRNRESYILKFPKSKHRKSYKEWLSHIQREHYFLKECAPKTKAALLPRIIECTKDSFVQTKIEGAPLTQELYQALSSQEQSHIVQNLATFFILLHQKTSTDKDVLKAKRIYLSPSLKQCLDPEEISLFKRYANSLRKTKTPSSPACICLTDLKADHILYDRRTQKLGLIDFGSIRYGTPEDEFKLENPVRSHLSLKMIKDIISVYNSQKEAISVQRIKCFLILSLIKEVYGCYKNRKISFDEKSRLKKIILDYKDKIENIF